MFEELSLGVSVLQKFVIYKYNRVVNNSQILLEEAAWAQMALDKQSRNLLDISKTTYITTLVNSAP